MTDQARRHAEIGGDATQRDRGQALGGADLDGLGQQFAVAFGGQLPLRVARLDAEYMTNFRPPIDESRFLLNTTSTLLKYPSTSRIEQLMTATLPRARRRGSRGPRRRDRSRRRRIPARGRPRLRAAQPGRGVPRRQPDLDERRVRRVRDPVRPELLADGHLDGGRHRRSARWPCCPPRSSDRAPAPT